MGSRREHPDRRRSLLALAGGLAGGLAVGLAGAARGKPPLVEIHLEPQPLDLALARLARQTGMELLFDYHLTAGRRAPAVRGRMTAEQALDRVLEGSGLRWRHSVQGAYLILTVAP